VSPRPNPAAAPRPAVLLLALLLAGCAGKPAPEPNPLGPEPPTEAEPAAVWNYLQGAHYQRFWHAEAVAAAGVHRSRAPHGPLIRTYVNGPADHARPLGASPLPAGSVVVLENYTAEPHLFEIDVMAKVAGHRPSTDGWAFFRFGPNGAVRLSDRQAYLQAKTEDRGCIHCHRRTAGETDWLYQPRLAD